jgi:hypothetical protein
MYKLILNLVLLKYSSTLTIKRRKNKERKGQVVWLAVFN